MTKYPRLDHFRHFLTMQQPCVSITVQVDITDWLSRLRASGCPFFLSFQYAVVRAANRIPEFRQRIVDDKIVEYDYCNPSYIVSLPDDTYRYCNVSNRTPLFTLSTWKRKKAMFWVFSLYPASPGSTIRKP